MHRTDSSDSRVRVFHRLNFPSTKSYLYHRVHSSLSTPNFNLLIEQPACFRDSSQSRSKPGQVHNFHSVTFRRISSQTSSIWIGTWKSRYFSRTPRSFAGGRGQATRKTARLPVPVPDFQIFRNFQPRLETDRRGTFILHCDVQPRPRRAIHHQRSRDVLHVCPTVASRLDDPDEDQIRRGSKGSYKCTVSFFSKIFRRIWNWHWLESSDVAKARVIVLAQCCHVSRPATGYGLVSSITLKIQIFRAMGWKYYHRCWRAQFEAFFLHIHRTSRLKMKNISENNAPKIAFRSGVDIFYTP